MRLLGSVDLPAEMLAVVPLEANGVVGQKATQVFDAPRAHCIIPSIDNRSGYVALHGGDTVLHFALDLATRRLTPLNPPGFPTEAQAGPRHLTLHAPSLRLFVLNERSGAVDALSVEPTTGALTPLASTSMLPVGYQATPTAADIHVTSDGRFLYASERTESFITIFAVDPATGALTPVDWVKTEASPRGFAIDPHDRFMLVAGQFSGRLSVYAIDPANGRLRKTNDRAVGTNPNWVEIVDVGGR